MVEIEETTTLLARLLLLLCCCDKFSDRLNHREIILIQYPPAPRWLLCCAVYLSSSAIAGAPLRNCQTTRHKIMTEMVEEDRGGTNKYYKRYEIASWELKTGPCHSFQTYTGGDYSPTADTSNDKTVSFSPLWLCKQFRTERRTKLKTIWDACHELA